MSSPFTAFHYFRRLSVLSFLFPYCLSLFITYPLPFITVPLLFIARHCFFNAVRLIAFHNVVIADQSFSSLFSILFITLHYFLLLFHCWSLFRFLDYCLIASLHLITCCCLFVTLHCLPITSHCFSLLLRRFSFHYMLVVLYYVSLLFHSCP